MPTDRLFSPFPTQPFALMVNKSPAWRSLITKKRGSRTSRQEHPFFSALLSSFTRREEGGKRRPEIRRRFAGWSRTGLQRTLPRLTVVTKCAGSLLKTLNPAFQDVYTSEAMKKISSLLNPKFALESLKSFLLEIGKSYGFFPPLTTFPWSRFRISRFLFLTGWCQNESHS